MKGAQQPAMGILLGILPKRSACQTSALLVNVLVLLLKGDGIYDLSLITMQRDTGAGPSSVCHAAPRVMPHSVLFTIVAAFCL